MKPFIYAQFSSFTFALLISLGSSSASAGVIWNLNNFVFDDSTRVTGWFEWDSGRVESWSIQTEDGFGTDRGEKLPLSGGSYTSEALGASAYTFSDETGRVAPWTEADFITFRGEGNEFRLAPLSLSSLFTAQSRLELAPTRLVGSTGFLECNNCSRVRYGLSGAYLSTSVASVPEPAGLLLLFTGLVGIAARFKFGHRI